MAKAFSRAALLDRSVMGLSSHAGGFWLYLEVGCVDDEEYCTFIESTGGEKYHFFQVAGLDVGSSI